MILSTNDKLAIMYFFHVPPDMILKHKIAYDSFPQREFETLLRCYDPEHSETENRLIYQNKKEYLNVFSVLLQIAEELLSINSNDVRCRYAKLRRWREITRYLGEDILVDAFFTQQFKRYGVEYNWFCWDSVLGHDNQQLNAIMKRGISDNHFHLFGSAPVFQLTWLRLMNDVSATKYVRGLQEIEHKRRNMHIHFDYAYHESSMQCMVLQAALMRAVMYAFLNGKQGILFVRGSRCGLYEDLLGYICRDEEICNILPEIRDIVNLFKAVAIEERSANETDYALAGLNDSDNLNWIFSGERALVYGMLCDILVKHELPEEVRALLYPYLVIRTFIHGEIVQNNENIGFENFSIYSGRKNNFLTAMKDTELMVRHAVVSSFEQGNLQSLEIRISPKDTYIEDAKLIKFYDSVIMKDGSLKKNQFFYVFHFAKSRDQFSSDDEYADMPCRDSVLRTLVRKRGFAIRELRERMPKEASRIYGIDACSQEIGCRPEVFAPVFRQLKNHVISFAREEEVRQLRITYHAGEDFLDMVDGLRALDEAIKFFDMGSGDRFGHATVLGLSVEKWYQRKNNRIEIQAQDYLDNVVWLYQKIMEFNLDGFDVLKDHLLNEFQRLFHQIYGVHRQKDVRLDIFTYYDAWKLRGDKPELYQSDKFVREIWFGSAEQPENLRYPENPEIRNNDETAYLYYRYHYDRSVRREGSCPMEVPILPKYVEAVKQVQAELQREIACKGIGIETNPSSNLMISTMADYDEHPIINLYNQGLKRKIDNRNAQLYVSINTDDKGVFHTSLENEYALMASELENMKDENGRQLYSPQEVYDWVEKIRVMGNQQIFGRMPDRKETQDEFYYRKNNNV
jgi:hypothetical protein